MTQPTTAEMVKELDDKFEGAITKLMVHLLDNFEMDYGDFNGIGKSKYVVNYDDYEISLEFEVQSGDENWYTLLFSKRFCKTFETVKLSYCISEAHDYFIVKGGEL